MKKDKIWLSLSCVGGVVLSVGVTYNMPYMIGGGGIALVVCLFEWLGETQVKNI